MAPRAIALALALAGCVPPGPAGSPAGSLQLAGTVCPKGATVEGVDVSAYQPNTDWMAVAQSGRVFALIKATESTGYFNSYYDQDRAGTKAAGIISGAYHFFRGDTDGTAQADYFVSKLGTYGDGDLPPVLDLETMDGQDAATVSQRALDFLNRVQQSTGKTPAVYVSPGFFSGLGNPAGFERFWLWVANWQVNCPDVPGSWTDWPLWQYADNGSVPGIAGAVDLDKFNGTVDDLRSFVSSSPPLAQASGNDAVGLIDWPDQHLELFALDAAGNALRMNTTGTDDSFTMPVVLDANAQCGFAGSFWGPPWSYPELFAPLASGSTGHLWLANGTWNTFQDYGGAGLGLGHLSTLVWRDGRSEVFALGQDGAIWHDFWDLTKSDWSGWGSLGGSFTTGASAIVWLDGHGELFAADGSGAAWHDYSGSFPGGWSGWSKLDGAQVASKPVPVRWSDGHVELFARAADGTLAHAWFDGMAWQPFQAVSPTAIAGEPQAMMNPKGGPGAVEGPEVFARTPDGQVVHLYWNGTAYADFQPLGALTAASDPFGWIRGDSRGEVFAVDSSGALERSLRDDQGAWGAWAKLADGIQPCAPPLASPPGGDGGGGGGPDGGGSSSTDMAGGGIVHSGCSCAIGARAAGAPWAMLVFGVAWWIMRRRDRPR